MIVYIENDEKCFLCVDSMVLQFYSCIKVENTIILIIQTSNFLEGRGKGVRRKRQEGTMGSRE